MPISAPDDTVARLVELAHDYKAEQVVLLGDIVHKAVPVPALRDQLDALSSQLSSITIRWIAGNHDRHLHSLLHQCGLTEIRLESELTLGAHLLIHGDEKNAKAAEIRIASLGAARLIMGHEHPAIHLNDRVTTSIRCHCFLAGPQILVLPAFSRWSAGSNIRSAPFMSAYARAAAFSHAYAILGGRILPVPL